MFREGDEDYLCSFPDFLTVAAKTQFLLRSLLTLICDCKYEEVKKKGWTNDLGVILTAANSVQPTDLMGLGFHLD